MGGGGYIGGGHVQRPAASKVLLAVVDALQPSERERESERDQMCQMRMGEKEIDRYKESRRRGRG
jgi:hypothetical protein